MRHVSLICWSLRDSIEKRGFAFSDGHAREGRRVEALLGVDLEADVAEDVVAPVGNGCFRDSSIPRRVI